MRSCSNIKAGHRRLTALQATQAPQLQYQSKQTKCRPPSPSFRSTISPTQLNVPSLLLEVSPFCTLSTSHSLIAHSRSQRLADCICEPNFANSPLAHDELTYNFLAHLSVVPNDWSTEDPYWTLKQSAQPENQAKVKEMILSGNFSRNSQKLLDRIPESST